MAKEGPHIHVFHVLQMAEQQPCVASSAPAFPSDPDSINTISDVGELFGPHDTYLRMVSG